MPSENIVTEAVLTKTEKKNIDKAVILFKMVPFEFNTLVTASFPFVDVSLKLHHCFLNILHVLKTYP